MELTIGPFDPALHVRSRDHYEAVRREARLLELQPETVPRRWEALLERLAGQFPSAVIDDVVDRAYEEGAPLFTARVVLADDLVPAAVAACEELEVLLGELDRWARQDGSEELLAPSQDVAAYRAALLAQVRGQLEGALASGPADAGADR